MKTSILLIAALALLSIVAVTAGTAPPAASAPVKAVPLECLAGCTETTVACYKVCDHSTAQFGCRAKCAIKAAECAANCEINNKATPAAAPVKAAAVAAPVKAVEDIPVVCMAECAAKTVECEKNCKKNHKHFGCKAKCALKAAECAAECEVTPAAALTMTEKPRVTKMSEQQYQAEFTRFVKKHNKKYTHDEFFPRYNIFKANLNKIRRHAMTKSTFTMAVNEFADMTFTEFHSKMTGYKARDNTVQRTANSKVGPHLHVKNVPASVDWRLKGAVTPVKNQQQCGACWAFSTTGSTEGAHAIKTGKLVSLSEQQLIDCSTAQGNQGCNGGMMDQAFQYIISNHGITTEASYPFTAADGTCNTHAIPAATISSFVDVTSGDENALMKAVALGPVSIAIEADQQCFQFYSGGVLSDPTCGTQLDHGVLIVGYGTDAASNMPYWIVKNSWGPSWGESGYIRLERGVNECGLATDPSYPVV